MDKIDNRKVRFAETFTQKGEQEILAQQEQEENDEIDSEGSDKVEKEKKDLNKKDDRVNKKPKKMKVNIEYVKEKAKEQLKKLA